MRSLTLVWLATFGIVQPASAMTVAPPAMEAASTVQDLEPAGPGRTILPLSGPIAENPADVVESWDREAEYGRFMVVEAPNGGSGQRLYLVFRAFGSAPQVAFLIGEAAGWRQMGDDGVTILLDSTWIDAGPENQRPMAGVRLRVERTPDLSAPASITATPMRVRRGE
ncbi:MAG: hypothetical protein ACXW3O_14270 [Brevundimonas sp.]